MTLPANHLEVIVNGSRLELPKGITVQLLLEHLEIRAPMVAVERNLEIVPKAEFDNCRLADGDQIEIVHFIGGG